MARYVRATRQAEHSGKSGYIATSKIGSPKPFPYGVAEEYATSFYPSYRPFIPERIRKTTDSLYDLRTKKYKYWYDKWGKPHINKWWRNQLDATKKIREAYEQVRRNDKYSTFTKFNRQRGSNQRPTGNLHRRIHCTCGVKYVRRPYGNRPRYRTRKWFSRRKNYY